MNLYLNHPLGVPIGTSQRKFIIDPHIAGSMITGGVDLLGSLLGFGSNKSANEANIAMQRETNAQNYKMFQEQLQYNTDMWNKTNEYNDPSAQMKRLKEAGLNPYLALDKAASAGTASMGSTPAPSPAQIGAPIQPEVSPSVMQHMSQIGSSAVDMYMKLVDADFKTAEKLAQLKRLENNNLVSGQTYKNLRFQLEKEREMLPLIKSNYERTNTLLARQADTEIEKANQLDWQNRLSQYDYEIKNPLEVEQLKKITAKLDKEIEYYAYEVATGRISANAAATGAMASLQAQHLEQKKWDALRDVTVRKIMNEADRLGHHWRRGSKLPFGLWSYEEEGIDNSPGYGYGGVR